MEKRNYIVAIDLGSSNVSIVVGYRDEEGKIQIVDSAVKPSEGMARGEIKNIEQVAKSIKEAVDEIESRLNIKIIEAYTGISGQHIKCAPKSYHVFVGSDGEIKKEDVQKLSDSMRTVRAAEGEKIIHFIPQNYIINDEEEVADPVGMFGQKLEATFNFIIADSSAVSRHEKALTKVDIRQGAMFLNPLASAESVVFPDDREMGVAVVDIGGGTTDVCIYHDRIVRHIGVIPIGSDAINRDIRAYGILERYVEELKVKYGCALAENANAEKSIKVPGRTPKEISFRNLAMIVEARMTDIAEYVAAEIERAGYAGRLGAGVILTGGGAQLPDVDLLFKNILKLEVRVASAEGIVGEASREVAADTRLTTAIGILVRGIDTGRKGCVDDIRKIPSFAPAASAAPAPGAKPAKPEPVAAAKPPKGGTVVDDQDDTPDERGKKSSWLDRIKGKVTGMFDVVDDDQII